MLYSIPSPYAHHGASLCYDVGQAGRYTRCWIMRWRSILLTINIGIRAGRIRRPQGIYNDIQDVDLGRTFVLLPQGLYDARWRDFYVSLDGGEIFGSVPLGRPAAWIMKSMAEVIRRPWMAASRFSFATPLPSSVHLDEIHPADVVGGQLWWHTPIDGLRLGQE